MNPLSIAILVGLYFGLIMFISWLTGRKADNEAFFIGNRNSPWYVVAFGMIGASLSGITFISVPGWVIDTDFTYMQIVLGYLIGYAVIANVLMPVYYKLKLTSIYTYLEGRFGVASYKTGAAFFLLSRTIGAAFRLFLVATVLQLAVFDAWHIPFYLTVLITIALIWLYTNRGGIRTIIWTDTLQTLFMLLAVVFSIWAIGSSLGLGAQGMYEAIRDSGHARMFNLTDWKSADHFLKGLLSGAFITITMTGLDQDMMQKNLSCRNIGEAKKNMYWFSISLLFVNLLFLAMGALLLIYSGSRGIAVPGQTDTLYPALAMSGELGTAISLFFILGLIAAAYSSADSALTSLTTSFVVDILNIKKYKEKHRREKVRKLSHVMFSVLLAGAILIFNAVNDRSVIESLFTVAGYTYGPLLGLYAFGFFTKMRVKDRLVPLIAILSPLLSYLFQHYAPQWLNGYQVGFELLIINGALTFAGLFLIKKKPRG
jgi:Na+/proline symporter